MYRDIAVLLVLQQGTAHPALYWLSILLSQYVIFALAALVGVLGFGEHRRKDRAYAYGTAWAALLALGSSLVIGWFVKRPRPFTLPDIVSRIKPPFTEYSFPSSHSAVAFAIAASLTLAHPWLGAIAFVLAALVAAARVAVGVHFPTDVLAGAALGIFCALLIHWYRVYLLPRSMRKNKR